MTYERFQQFYIRLCEHRAIDPSMPHRMKQCRAWWDAFGRHTEGVLAEAFRRCNLTYDFLPTPAQIQRAIEDTQRAQRVLRTTAELKQFPRPTQEEADRGHTAMAIAMHGVKGKMTPERIDAAIERLRTLGPGREAHEYFTDEGGGDGGGSGSTGGSGGGGSPGDGDGGNQGLRSPEAHPSPLG